MNFIFTLIKTYLVVILVGLAGWLINLYQVTQFPEDMAWSAWMLIEYLGVFVLPLGSLMGILTLFGVGP